MNAIQHISVTETTYERIRNAIFSGQLQPGERLNPRELAATLHVSTQPVKAVLNRLHLEGMVVIRPRSGSFVRNLTRKEAAEVLEVRLMIEMYALRCQPRLSNDSDAVLSELVDTMTLIMNTQPYDWIKYNEYDMAFHERLVALSGNRELLRVYQSLHSHYVTGRYYYGQQQKANLSHPDHDKILTALRRGQYDQVATLVEEHIRTGINYLLRTE